MATLTFQLSGAARVNGSKSYTISDADVDKWIDWARTRFGAGTDSQALIAWTQWCITLTVADVRRANVKTASDSAAAGVTPVVFS